MSARAQLVPLLLLGAVACDGARGPAAPRGTAATRVMARLSSLAATGVLEERAAALSKTPDTLPPRAGLVSPPARGANAGIASRLRPEVLGTVFVYDPTRATFVASTRPGAPAAGVRFIDYATRADGVPDITREIGFSELENLVSPIEGMTNLRVRVVRGAEEPLRYEIARSTDAAPLTAIVGVLREPTDQIDVDVMLAPPSGDPAGHRVRALLTSARSGFTFGLVLDTLTRDGAQPVTMSLRLPDGEIIVEGRLRGGELDGAVSVEGIRLATVRGPPAAVRVSIDDPAILSPVDIPAIASVVALMPGLITFVANQQATVDGVLQLLAVLGS